MPQPSPRLVWPSTPRLEPLQSILAGRSCRAGVADLAGTHLPDWRKPRTNMTDDATLSSVRTAIEAFVDPYQGESLGNAHAVRDVASQAGGGYVARIALGFPVGDYRDKLTASLQQHLTAAGLNVPLTLELEADIRAHAVQRNLKPIEQIKNI